MKAVTTLVLFAAILTPTLMFTSACSSGSSGDATDEADESLTSEDPQEAAELEAELAKDDAVVTTEVSEALADEDFAEGAFDLGNGAGALDVEAASNGGATAAKCKKTITLVETVGLPHTVVQYSNGCWGKVATDDGSYRRCWYAKPIADPKAKAWVYDDTNIENNLGVEDEKVRACDDGTPGFEYMANRGGWRFVRTPHVKAYFAELYSNSDPRNIDNLFHIKSAYKTNAEIHPHRLHTFPMLSLGARDERVTLEHQVLAACKTVRNGGYVGIYNAYWQPSDSEHPGDNDARLRRLAIALNECTAPKPPKKK